MKNPLRITFNCSNYHLPNFKSIEVNGEAIHQIVDVMTFYEALGYTREIQSSGMMPEEFIWEEYVRHGSRKSIGCLNAKLTEYLKLHSAAFVEKFGNEIDVLLEICHAADRSGGACRATCPQIAGNGS